MKFQLLFCLAIALFFSLFALSLPISAIFPDFGPPAVAKPNENDLFLSRWQSNFGSRLTKPSAAPPILSIPADIRAATKPTKPSLSADADWDPRKLYDIDLDPEQPPVFPIVMHGALNFLKPAIEEGARKFLKPAVQEPVRDIYEPAIEEGAREFLKPAVQEPVREFLKPAVQEPVRDIYEPAFVEDTLSSRGSSSVEEDWRDWTPLSRDSPRVGLPLPEDEKKSFTPPMPIVLFRQKPETLLPPNTVTKEDLLRHVVNLAADNTYCPGCGEDMYEKKPGWKSRFAAWFKALWKKVHKVFSW